MGFMAYRPWKPSSVVTEPISGTLGGPFGVTSKRSVSVTPTRSMIAAKRSGRQVSAPPISMPPALAPWPARYLGAVVRGHEVLGATDEVEDRVELGKLLPARVPVLAVLAAAHVGDADHAAALDPGEEEGEVRVWEGAERRSRAPISSVVPSQGADG